MVRGYSEQTLKAEPVVQLAVLTGLDADLSSSETTEKRFCL
ncbi:hypothetical protein [Vibrio alginolyticus]|nr:hypothetical protein [Vibrio alginolyticus]MCZ6395499.1 hypothetical protein [Vibrio alginolyticus]